MKMKLLINISIIIFLANGILSADESVEKKNKILIYNFHMIKTPDEKITKGQKRKNYGYYSFIIPETTSKKLIESERFIIKRINNEIPGYEVFTKDSFKPDYINELSSIAKDTSSDYIITGEYDINDNILNVRLFIYESATKNLMEGSASGEEAGIYLLDTTDTLSGSIEDNISDIIVEQIEEKIKSPFLTIAAPLRYTSFGFDAGYIYFSDIWKDVYKDAVYYSPYIEFDLASFLDLSFKFDYFKTDSKDSDISYSTMSVMGGSALLGLNLQFFSNFGIYLSAGGGMVRSEITLNMPKPFSDSPTSEKSTDPAAEIALGFKLNLSSVYIRTGALFKRIYYEDETMDLKVLYGGVGIHF